MSRLPVPTGRLALLAVVACALVVSAPLPPAWSLMAVDGVLVALALVDWALAPRLGAVALQRELPRVVPLHGEAEIVWRVRNPTGRRLRLWLADELAPSLGADTRRARLVVPPGGAVSAHVRLRPWRRGRFTPTEVVIRVAGPLGLTCRQGRRSLPGELRVYPPLRSGEETEVRIRRGRLLEVGLRSVASRGGGTEFDSLREYQVDDEFRRIDWAATARSGGRAIVRTYRAERNQQVLVLLDGGRTMAGTVGGVPRFDHALDAVLMLTSLATRLGDRAGLVAFDSEVRSVVPPGHRPDQLTRVTDAVYALEPRLVESDYRQAFGHTLTRFRRRALLVLCSELAEQAMQQTLLPALPLVVRDHLVIVASVGDPDVERWAGSAPATAGDAYRGAAALANLDERRRVAARLRALGATVLDAPPGRLAPRLADAYLEVKATGRL